MPTTSRFLRCCAALLLLSGCAVLAQQPARCRDPLSCYDTVKLAENAYAFIAAESSGGVVSGNSVLLIGSESALVFDSGHFPSLTRTMIAEIRRITPKPVRYLVNSHWHPDHNAGNGYFREAFPGISIVSAPYTREQFDGLLKQNSTPEGTRQTVQFIDRLLADNKYLDGSPLDEVKRAYILKAKSEFERMVPEVEQARHTAPDLVIDRSVTLDLGGVVAKVMFLGRGNTGGDVILHVPAQKLLATGDLVVHPTPYAIGSYFSDWIATMNALAALDAETIIPGHGQPQHDKQYIAQVTALLESMMRQVRASVAQGRTLEETRRNLDFSAFLQQLPKDDPTWPLAFDATFVAPGVARAYKEVKEGKLD